MLFFIFAKILLDLSMVLCIYYFYISKLIYIQPLKRVPDYILKKQLKNKININFKFLCYYYSIIGIPHRGIKIGGV